MPERKTTPPLTREAQSRRMQVRGLLWLALLVIVFSIVRAGLHNAFPHGWWRLW